MTIDQLLSKPDLLEVNYQNILSKTPRLLAPHTKQFNDLLQMPSTHTFGYEKVGTDPKGGKMDLGIFPYKSILFDKKALLSDSYRHKMAGTTPNSPTRTMTKARKFGLDNYVFAYLGLHEYYYAKCGRFSQPAFGLFLDPAIDYDINANATLYDLQSQYASGFTPQEMALTIYNARNLTTYEIVNIFKDFFNYWICHDYASKDYHDDNMWEQKREFHYREKVELTNYEAIIWPIEYILNTNDDYEPRAGAIEELSTFRSLHGNIFVYQYQWIESVGLSRFSYASYLVSNHKFVNSTYLAEKDFEDLFLAKHPNY